MSEYLPPVVARLLGEVTDFQEKFGAANETMSATEGKAASAGSAVSSHFGAGMAVAGAAISGVGMELTHLGDGLETARKQLEAAGKAAGLDMGQLDEITSKADKSMENFGRSSSETDNALAKFVQAGRPAEELTKDMALAADLAASKHISLTTAAGLIDKVYAGNAKALKEYGIVLKANATDEEKEAALAELGAKVHGQAAAAVDTFGGRMEVAKVKIEDFAAGIGTKIGPAMAVAGPAIGGVGMIVQSGLVPGLISGVGAAASFGAGMIGAGASAVAAAIPVIVAWAPVILLVAAIGLAAYELYKHWDEAWGFIKGIASDAYDWVRKHLLLIAEIVLAPVAPLILLWQHWDEVWGLIKNITSDAWDWLRRTVSTGVDDVVGFVERLPGRAVGALSSLGGDLAGAAADGMSSMWDATERGVSDVVGDVSRLPGRALDAMGNLGGYLWDAGVQLMEGMIGGIGSMARRLGDAAMGVVRGAVSAVKGFLGIGSPSRLFHGYGVNVGEGLEQGMVSKQGDVGAAALGLASASVAGFGGGSVTGGGSALAAGGGGTTVVNFTPQLVVQTATGDIPDETIRKLRAQLFAMGNDVPPSQLLPAA